MLDKQCSLWHEIKLHGQWPRASHESGVLSWNPGLVSEKIPHFIVDAIPGFSLGLQEPRLSRQGPVHPVVTAFLVAGVGAPGGVVLLQLLLPQVATVRVGYRVLEVRLAAVHSRLVHAYFELAGSGDGHAAAAVVVLVEGVEIIAVMALGAERRFGQWVDDHNQYDWDSRAECARACDACLHLKYQQHKDGRGWGRKQQCLCGYKPWAAAIYCGFCLKRKNGSIIVVSCNCLMWLHGEIEANFSKLCSLFNCRKRPTDSGLAKDGGERHSSWMWRNPSSSALHSTTPWLRPRQGHLGDTTRSR